MRNNRFTKVVGIVLVSFFFIGGLPWRELKADAETHCEYNCSPLLIVYDQTASWDTLSDGEEMGTMYRIVNGELDVGMNQGTIPTIEDHDWERILSYLPNTDYMYIFYPTSNPTLKDSDDDGALDPKDATPLIENGPINYIFIGHDRILSCAISCMRKPYEDAFKLRGEDVIVLDIWFGSDYYSMVREAYPDIGININILFRFAFQRMNRNLEGLHYNDKIAYSYVNTCVVIAHGASNLLEFQPDYMGDDNQLSYQDILDPNKLTLNYRINILDIQACFCGAQMYINDDYYQGETCIAELFSQYDEIEEVYAWTGKVSFKGGVNISENGEYYLFSQSLPSPVCIGNGLRPLQYTS